MGQEMNDYLLLTTKLTIPPAYLKNIVSRAHLYDRLDANVQRPLTLITAPAGCGKTTLLSEWIRERGIQAAWVSLEGADNDLVRFWRYVLTSLSALHPTIYEQIKLQLQALQPLTVETTLVAVINAFSTHPHEVVLVLDDYQAITAASIHQSLSFLLEHLPAQTHLVIATRVDPPLPLARLRVQGKLTELRATDLRFTDDQAAVFLRQTMNLALSPQQAEELNKRTEGWIAGLQLAALSLQGRQDPAATTSFITSFTGTNRHILHYLSDEVLARQPEDVQHFLLVTSILERMNASLCDAVTRQSNGLAMLEWLDHANLFLLPQDTYEHWYRYSRLFADLLQHRLKHTYPHLLPQLHMRASVWYEEHGFMVEAARHALASGNKEYAADTIERYVWPLMRQGEDTLVYIWLNQLPESVFASRPSLSYLHAWTYLSTAQLKEFELSLQHAETIWREEKQSAMLGRVYDFRSYAALLQDNGRLGAHYAQQALALGSEDDLLLRGSATVNAGRSYLLLGDTARAYILLSEGYAMSQHAHHLVGVLIASLSLGRLHIIQGDLHAAAASFHQMLPDIGEQWVWYRIAAHIRLAEIYYQWNDSSRTVDHWQQAMSLVEQAGREGFATAERFTVAAQHAWLRGEQEQALSWLEKAEYSSQRFGENHIMLAEITARRVQFLLAGGNTSAALQWYEQYAQNAPAIAEMSPYEKEAYTIMHARLHIASAQAERAIVPLKNSLQAAQDQGRRDSEIALLVLLILAYHNEGNIQQAMQTLERALVLAEAGGYIRVFIDEGPVMVVLLKEFYSRYQKRSGVEGYEISSSYLSSLLTGFGYEALPPSSMPARKEEVQPALLSEREQMVLDLIAAGLSNQEIAQKLVVTVSTVKTHLNNIYAKLQVHTRLQAVTKAYELGLLSRNERETEPLAHPNPAPH